jgi:hypothetical protein
MIRPRPMAGVCGSPGVARKATGYSTRSPTVLPPAIYVVASRITAAVIDGLIQLFVLNIRRQNGRANEFRQSLDL